MAGVLADRKRLAMGAAIMVVVISALIGLALGGPSRVDRDAQQGAGAASAAPTVSSRLGVPPPSNGAAVPPPAATGVPSSPPVAGSEPIASVSPGGSAGSDPSNGTSAEPSPSTVGSDTPEGKRLDSAGGFVYAVCGQGKATLTSWQANAGFTVEKVNAGPALTAEVVFAGGTRYRMAVTCVAGSPTPLVLPI